MTTGWPSATVRGARWALGLPVLLTAACTASTSVAPAPTSVPTTSAGRTSTSPEAPPALTGAPPTSAGLRTLLVTQPQQGDAVAGSFSAVPGTLVVSFDCLGSGDLSVDLGTGEALSTPCTADRVFSSVNRLTTTNARTGTVAVHAGPDVRWTVRLEQ